MRVYRDCVCVCVCERERERDRERERWEERKGWEKRERTRSVGFLFHWDEPLRCSQNLMINLLQSRHFKFSNPTPSQLQHFIS